MSNNEDIRYNSREENDWLETSDKHDWPKLLLQGVDASSFHQFYKIIILREKIVDDKILISVRKIEFLKKK